MVLHRVIQAARDADLAALRSLASSGQLSLAVCDAQGAGPVHHAARCGRLDCLQLLVSDLGLPADSRASNGATAAHDAAATGNIRELQWLVQRGGCSVEVCLVLVFRKKRAEEELSMSFRQWRQKVGVSYVLMGSPKLWWESNF